MLVDDVYCYASFGLFIGNDSFVDIMTIHSLAAIFGQQRRVYIDDAVWKSIEQILRYKQKESREDDIVNVSLLQEMQDVVGFEKRMAIEVFALYSEHFGTLCYISILFIIYNYINIDRRFVGKIFCYLLCIGAVARSKDCQLDSF